MHIYIYTYNRSETWSNVCQDRKIWEQERRFDILSNISLENLMCSLKGSMHFLKKYSNFKQYYKMMMMQIHWYNIKIKRSKL